MKVKKWEEFQVHLSKAFAWVLALIGRFILWRRISYLIKTSANNLFEIMRNSQVPLKWWPKTKVNILTEQAAVTKLDLGSVQIAWPRVQLSVAFFVQRCSSRSSPKRQSIWLKLVLSLLTEKKTTNNYLFMAKVFLAKIFEKIQSLFGPVYLWFYLTSISTVLTARKLIFYATTHPIFSRIEVAAKSRIHIYRLCHKSQ